MEKYFLPTLLMMAIGLAHCAKHETIDAVGKQNKAIYGKYLQSFLKGDTKTLESVLAKNFMGYGPALKDSLNKHQFIESSKKEEIKKYDYKSIVRLPIHIDEGTAMGDWISE